MSYPRIHEPKAALKLKELFAKNKQRLTAHGRRGWAFVWTSQAGPDGTVYGSYKYVFEDDLAKREYLVYCADSAPSIFYTDVVYNPRTHRIEPKASLPGIDQ